MQTFILDELLESHEYHSKLALAKTHYNSLSESLTDPEITALAIKMIPNDPALAVALGSLAENIQLDEFIVRQVNSKGEVKRMKDRDTRKRLAAQTTGLSKARRREISRKAVRTKKSQPSKVARAVRTRKKAMKRRIALGY